MGIIITSPSPSHRQVSIVTRMGFEPTAPWLEWRALYHLSHAAYDNIQKNTVKYKGLNWCLGELAKQLSKRKVRFCETFQLGDV